MKILLFGCTGQVGWELQRSLSVLGEVVALDHDSTQWCGDFSNPQGVVATVRQIQPDVIVNAAAYTAVDKAESEPERARLLNATTPGLIAREAKELGALLVHFSTDYVFDGSGDRARDEQAQTAPLSVYGRTKLEGERLIQSSGCLHLIFRTSWVYAVRGHNFVKTILQLVQNRERLPVVNDQYGAPTGADWLADITAHAIGHVVRQPGHLGLYHCVAQGETSWYAYAQFVLRCAQRLRPEMFANACLLEPVASSNFRRSAPRPHNSRMDTSKLHAKLGLHLPHWQQGVARMVHEYLEKMP